MLEELRYKIEDTYFTSKEIVTHTPVSYTHLDVYKRQVYHHRKNPTLCSQNRSS